MRNIDFVIKKTALDLNLPEDKVKEVVMEYWKVLSDKILNGEETTITARHIGTFTVSKWKLNKQIRKIIAMIRLIRKMDKLTDEAREERFKKQYKRLRHCLYHRNIVAKSYAKTFENEITKRHRRIS